MTTIAPGSGGLKPRKPHPEIIVPFSPHNRAESRSQKAEHLPHITPVAGANWGSLDGSLDGSLMIAPRRPIGPGASVARGTSAQF